MIEIVVALMHRSQFVARKRTLFNPILYPGIGSVLRISQEEIGHLVGLSRPRVNQALKLLQERQFLRIERVGVTILDLERLRRFEG